LAATPRQILSALGKRRWAKVAALKARFSGLDLDGLTYATAMTPAGESYYAWLVAQARVKQRQQLGLDASPDVLRAAVVASHAAVLETTGYDDRASADARATSSGAAAFEALRQRDEDLVGRAGGYHAQCRALKARLDAAGFGVQDWSANATPKDTPFFLFMAARVREAARERLGQNVSALRAAFAEIRDIFREVADFEDDARAVSSDAAAFDALAAADADVVNSARRKPKPKPAPKQKPAPKPKPPPALRFPQKLADIVARHADVVSWNATAGKLVIVDQARFERDVMPRYFNTSIFDSFRAQLRSYGFSSVSESEVDASLPAGVIVYSNTAVADLTKLVKRKSTSRPAPAPKPERPSRAERAVQRAAQSPAPAAAGPKKKAKTDCEARRVGEPWRYFVSQADAARAFPELTRADVSVLINNPSKVKVAVRGRFEARKVTERPAADEASSAPKRPRVHDDDDDNAAPGSGPAPELDGEVPPQNAPVAARAAAAAAAVAAVAAPPVLAPPAAAGASPKRARAASPVGVTARVQFTHLRETRDVHLTGGGGRRRRGAAETGAVRGGRAAAVLHGRRAGARCLGRRLQGSAPCGRRGRVLAALRRGRRRKRRRAPAPRRGAARRARGAARRGPAPPLFARRLPVGSLVGGPSGAWEWSLWTWACSRRLGWEACAEGWVSRGGVGRGG